MAMKQPSIMIRVNVPNTVLSDVLLSCTHRHTHSHFTALWILSGTTRVSLYQKKHSPSHTYL